MDSDLADDPWFHRTLSQYFPAQIRERFDAELDTHPLRKEIISTVVANQIINFGGIAFAYRVVDDSGSDLADVARAFTAAMEIFELESYADRHAQLGADVPLEVWNRMSLRMRRLLDRVVRWFLHRQDADTGIQELVDTYRPIVALRFGSEHLMGPESEERTQTEAELAERHGVPRDLAVEWAELLDAFALLDVARLAEQQGITGPAQDGTAGGGGGAAASSSERGLTGGTDGNGVSVQMIARVYFSLFDRYGLENLLNRISALPQTTRWENMARIAMREDLYSTLVALAAQALESPGEDAQQKVQAWEQENADRLERLREVLDEIESMSESDDAGAELAALSVALRTLRGALVD